ncbi:MAG TPA: D-alanyl-D-alanine carboxypeptidase/D-alanyl-D-alanine-endopeptidase [Planococcus sp. (in: firmicutes)]|nr:D-alanyl-D-alanine carboxypeptidase/D-alanyl-D-alanine-endopeptidase [Planococcus sp. (in: firmicutes)]
MLSKVLKETLDDKRIEGTIIGVSVREAETGEIVFEEFGDIRLKPASNMKLFTAAAALENLGQEYRFSTELRMDGKIVEGVLDGNLYLVGKGDPTLLEEDFGLLAARLAALKIHRITGNLIGDDSWYDDVRLSSGITHPDEVHYYAAEVSALTASPSKDYDTGSVLVEISTGTEEGSGTKVSVTPETDHVSIMNNSITVSASSPNTLSITRRRSANEIVIDGGMPLEEERISQWVAVSDPTMHALRVFNKALLNAGIQTSEKFELKQSQASDERVLLAERKSIRLSELLIPFMKLSNNGIGEILTKEMGKVLRQEGTWDAGLAVIEETSSRLGVNTKTMQFKDGSGMSHVNLIPANEITQLLYVAQQSSWFEPFLTALPVAGVEERMIGGTLRNRMNEGFAKGNVFAKTGTLATASSLAGYATTRDGERMIFSVIVNNDLTENKSLEDSIANTIAGYKRKET